MTAVPLPYLLEGPRDGELVVLSGSLGSDLRMWDPQVGALTAAGYRVVRYDHRGHGQSPVPAGPYTLADLGADVVELLDRVGAPQAHFVGLSLGGMVGIWLAQHAGHRLRSLTLCCTSAELGPASGWADRAAAVRQRGMRALSTAVVERWFTPQWRAAGPQQVRYYEAMVAATPAEGYAACCEAIQTMDIACGLSDISTPTLVIAGADDPATPPDHGRRIATAIPSGRLEIVSPAAHLANVECTPKVNALILGHLFDS
ncbi:MAG: 3-oxoadipate enol-lactonase [Mycolicibacterium sp.]|nr:3-oxoadipate enol-lactonase [Mycolicibacterium sp.]